MMKRIDFIDGLRGVALLSVILFHVYSRWSNVMPFGNTYADFPVFKFGFMGVLLFFLISGFVILMSLEKTEKFSQFMYKRWLRLFPAMLIATILLYSTAFLLPERPCRPPELNSVVPGLLFTDIYWIELFTGFKIKYLEGSFWSLIVEFKLYLIFGMLYFALGKSRALVTITLLHLVWVISSMTGEYYTTFLSNFFSLQFFGWFAAGAWAYLFYAEGEKKYFVYACLVGLLNLLQYRNDFPAMIGVIVVLLIFLLPVYVGKVRSVLSSKALLFIGFISYPLYLIHENAIIGLTIKLSKEFKSVSPVLLSLIVIVMIGAVAYLITKYAEPLVKKLVSEPGLTGWRNSQDYANKKSS